MKRLIVNADDFGINEVVTAEIERMAKNGAISSTTVMANGTCLDEVKRFAKEHPEMSYGVHLCLSEYASITKSKRLYDAGLTNAQGNFIHKAIFGLKSLGNTAMRKAIKEELNAQIDIVSALGFPISHADSHHHVHTIYPLHEVFYEVLRERGIDRLRIAGKFRSWRKKTHVSLWVKRNRLNHFYSNNFITTNDFYSYAEFLQVDCPIGENQVIELMCHPGHPGSKYQDEMKLVEAKTALYDKSIKLITYNDL